MLCWVSIGCQVFPAPPWASSFGSGFNFDFSVGFTQEQQREGGIEYNYRREAPLVRKAGGGEGAVAFAARAPKGRNETGAWWRRHDEYDKG
jgi:predicted dithiol-disulfide oxidoreductase (DUF899 family)